MPRQLLPEKYHLGPWSIGIDELNKRPELVAIIGRCLTLWPDVELLMAVLLATLLKANTEAVVAVYLTIRTGRARRDAMNAAAKATLDPKDLELFQATLNVYRSVEAERNDLAHGCYGIADDIPNGVLWVEAKHHAEFMIDAHRTDSLITRHSDFAKKLFLYRKSDLEQIRDNIKTVWQLLFDLIPYLHHSPLDEEVYRLLCAAPLLRQELARMWAGQSNP